MTSGNQSQAQDPKKPWYERFPTWCENVTTGLGSGFWTLAEALVASVVALFATPSMILVKLFKLDVWNESLLTPKARSELIGWSVTLGGLAVFAYNNWAGLLMENVWPEKHWMARMLAVVFTVIFIVVERLLIVSSQDVKTNLSRLIRGLQIALFSLMLAIPFELRVTHDTLWAAFDQREDAQLAVIRARAKTEEMAILQGRAATQATGATQSVQQWRTERANQRAELVTQQTNRHNSLQHEADVLSQQTSHESMGGTGHHGVGVVAIDLRSRTAAAQRRLDASDAAARQELSAFDTETNAGVQVREAGGNGAQANIEIAMDAKRREIDAMSGQALVRRYGGQYDHGRGFLDQVGMLHHLMDTDGRIRWTVYACRLSILLIELTPVLGGILMSLELKRYYNFRAQVGNGQSDALAMALNMGITDPVAYGRDEGIQKKMNEVYAAHRTCEAALNVFYGQLYWLCQPPAQGGLAASFDRILSAINANYATYRQAFLPVEIAEEALITAGGSPLDRSARLLDEVDPRTFTRQDLEQRFGWVDPQRKIDEAMEALGQISGLRAELVRCIARADQKLYDLVRLHAPRWEINNVMMQYWWSEVVAVLRELDEAEQKVARIAEVVPPWTHIADPRPTMFSRIGNPSDERLAELGYKDPGVQLFDFEVEDVTMPDHQADHTPRPN